MAQTLSCWLAKQNWEWLAINLWLPPIEASDLVSFLVLETSFATAKQFKAYKWMEAYNQFVSGWVKEVSAWNINHKSVVWNIKF